MSATNQSAQDSAPCDTSCVSASIESERSTQPERTRSRTFLGSERGQMQQDLPSVILMIGIAVVSGFVVLYLSSEVIAAINMSPGGPNESAPPLYDSYVALEQATNSAFGLFGLLFIVVILSVAIVYLWRIRGAR